MKNADIKSIIEVAVIVGLFVLAFVCYFIFVPTDENKKNNGSNIDIDDFDLD